MGVILYTLNRSSGILYELNNLHIYMTYMYVHKVSVMHSAYIIYIYIVV